MVVIPLASGDRPLPWATSGKGAMPNSFPVFVWKACCMAKLEMSPEFLQALQTLSALLESEDALERTLETVVDLSVKVLPGCDAAGITLRVDGRELTAAASDEFTLEIDRIQYELDQGPCLTALESSTVQKVEVVSEDSRWPEFSRHALEEGLHSVLSLPIDSDGMAGALNLYAKTERAFEDEAIEGAGEVFATQAGIAVRNAQTYLAARRVTDQLNEALQTRDMIGQAKGILMEREGISDAEAFEMLKTISQNSNMKLREIADKLIKDKKRDVGRG